MRFFFEGLSLRFSSKQGNSRIVNAPRPNSGLNLFLSFEEKRDGRLSTLAKTYGMGPGWPNRALHCVRNHYLDHGVISIRRRWRAAPARHRPRTPDSGPDNCENTLGSRAQQPIILAWLEPHSGRASGCRCPTSLPNKNRSSSR